MKAHWSNIILAGVVAGLVSGCELYPRPPGGEIVVSGAPPPPPQQEQVQSPMPGPGYAWIEGSWVWGADNKWDWQAGHWSHQPYPGAVWVPHHYAYHDGRHVYVEGRWE